MTRRDDGEWDLLVVGSGVAGLTAALAAHAAGLRALVVTKGEAGEGNTRWAQGGVAVVEGQDPTRPADDPAGDPAGGTADGLASHVTDTLRAGGGLCDEATVAALVADGPAALSALRRRGARFDRDETGRLARTREGGHSVRRVIHAGGDATGAEIQRALLLAAQRAALPLLSGRAVSDVLLDERGIAAGLVVVAPDGATSRLRAPAVLLATGGVGQLYAATTNSEVATGDGLALALRAGALATDVEFVQFHPTALYTGPNACGRRPLVTEALRGEGGVLVDAAGTAVMTGVHPLGDLAPRDVVAAAITTRMAERDSDHVYLDATHLAADYFRRRFPTVWAACAAAVIEPSTEPIPVAPAAHYHCGGVITDNEGRSTVRGLYAAGEVARTGLHGANRLASNSLLEGLVMGERTARAVLTDRVRAAGPLADAAPPGLPRTRVDPEPLRRAMSRHVGVGREPAGLARVRALLGRHAAPVNGRSELEATSLGLVASVIVAAAEQRRETRGCHVRTDCPRERGEWRRSITVALDDGGRPVTAVRADLGGAA